MARNITAGHRTVEMTLSSVSAAGHYPRTLAKRPTIGSGSRPARSLRVTFRLGFNTWKDKHEIRNASGSRRLSARSHHQSSGGAHLPDDVLRLRQYATRGRSFRSQGSWQYLYPYHESHQCR